jgi:hypothetical protein
MIVVKLSAWLTSAPGVINIVGAVSRHFRRRHIFA